MYVSEASCKAITVLNNTVVESGNAANLLI